VSAARLQRAEGDVGSAELGALRLKMPGNRQHAGADRDELVRRTGKQCEAGRC
jgi:hypothetical protein